MYGKGCEASPYVSFKERIKIINTSIISLTCNFFVMRTINGNFGNVKHSAQSDYTVETRKYSTPWTLSPGLD